MARRVVPSFYEPFGLVALEAIAGGCPCIVADTGGLREVVPSVGLRFRSRDSRSLADMIERVLVDDERRDRLSTRTAIATAERGDRRSFIDPSHRSVRARS